ALPGTAAARLVAADRAGPRGLRGVRHHLPERVRRRAAQGRARRTAAGGLRLMVIDKRLDILVWSAALLLLLLLGARAWAVETAGAKHYRTLARVRVLTGAVWVSLAVLLGLLGMQG